MGPLGQVSGSSIRRDLLTYLDCRVIFIVGKIGIVIVMLLFAIRMYLKKYQKCTVIPVMLFALIIAVSRVQFLITSQMDLSRSKLVIMMTLEKL